MEKDPGAKRVSIWDTLRLQVFVTVPAYVWGLVVPRRWGATVLCWLNAGQALQRFLDNLRRKYRSDHLWARFPFTRTLLVFEPGSIDAVLKPEESAPDPAIKKFSLSRFVPDGLIITSSKEWRERRAFSERTLDFGHLHRDAEAFNEIVRSEVDRLTADRSDVLRWPDFQRLGERISQQVLFGAGHLEPELARHLAKMAGWSNIPLRHRRSFRAFYATIDAYLARHRAAVRAHHPEPGGSEPVGVHCLVHRSAEQMEDGEAADSICVSNQIAFWATVLKDAIELHVARTLALMAAHPDIQRRVRGEILGAPVLTARSIDALTGLRACAAEQLRLWTPVPILLRRADAGFSLGNGISIEAGQQILIHAGYYHRDPSVFGDNANRFSPGRVGNGLPGTLFFSRHERSCAGQFLAMFLIEATLAWLLARFRFELIGPRLDAARIPYLYHHFRIELRGVHDAPDS